VGDHETRTGSGLHRRSWTSLPTAFVSAQRLSERTVQLQIVVIGMPLQVTAAALQTETLQLLRSSFDFTQSLRQLIYFVLNLIK
jgi:hypothetical protein